MGRIRQMKVSKETVALHRERMLQAAARLFMTHGYADVAVAQVMQAAGLTHGAFYGHFSAKEDLYAAACEWSMMRAAGKLRGVSRRELIERYLSKEHLSDRDGGCPIVALSSEVTHRRAMAAEAFERGFCAMLDAIAASAGGDSGTARRRETIATMASLVGAVVIARAVADEHLADEILDAVDFHLSKTGRDVRNAKGRGRKAGMS
jgi:TetR/AcrR family transcriptional regulator, transcriptional repressor for nem operon